jgi:hypothetical protein
MVGGSRKWQIPTCLPAALALGVAVSLAAGCGATRVQRSWTNPDVGPVTFRNVVSIAMTKDASRRQAMEEAMAGEIQDEAPGVEAVASRSILSDAEIIDERRVRDHLAQTKYDAAIVMRVTDVERHDVFVPGRTVSVPVYYRTFWGYYQYWAPIAYEPGYVERNRDVQVETLVYALRTGELVYSAVSRTLNPSSSAELVESVADVVANDLQAKGFLPRASSASAR